MEKKKKQVKKSTKKVSGPQKAKPKDKKIKITKRHTVIGSVILAVILAVVCFNSYITNSKAAVVKVKTISIKYRGELQSGGKTYGVFVTPSNVSNKNIVCSTSNKSIATVETLNNVTNSAINGVFGVCDVHPLKNGAVTITAKTTDGSNLKASTKITFAIKATKISMKYRGELQSGGKTYGVFVTPSTVINKNITCSSSNISVATVEAVNNVSSVDVNGKYSVCDVHKKKKGTVTVTAKTADGTNLKTSTTIVFK